MKTTKSKVRKSKKPISEDGIYGVDANKSRIKPVKSSSDIATKVKYAN